MKALVIFWSEFCTSGISAELQAKSHESHNSYQKLPLILYFFIAYRWDLPVSKVQKKLNRIAVAQKTTLIRLSVGSIVYRKHLFT
jgi:hypothetical protein